MSDSRAIDDALLIDQARGGDTEAFGALYDQYAEPVFRFLFTRLDNRMDAEDLTGEVFLRAWKSLPRYRQQGYAFSAYLFQIARNLLIDHYRRSGRVESLSDQMAGILVNPDSEPADVVVKELERKELRDTFSTLREDYQTVLTLRFVSGLSSDETAQVMGRSSGAVRVLQHRALAALKKKIEAE
jgi:RNA polymerase sigma-70 factor (ECF subfamily)